LKKEQNPSFQKTQKIPDKKNKKTGGLGFFEKTWVFLTPIFLGQVLLHQPCSQKTET